MLLLLCGPAWAQTAERPAVQVGDQWQFVMYWGMPSKEPNRVWVVDAVTPSGIDGRENGEPLRYTSDWLFKPKNSQGSSTRTRNRRTGTRQPHGRS